MQRNYKRSHVDCLNGILKRNCSFAFYDSKKGFTIKTLSIQSVKLSWKENQGNLNKRQFYHIYSADVQNVSTNGEIYAFLQGIPTEIPTKSFQNHEECQM